MAKKSGWLFTSILFEIYSNVHHQFWTILANVFYATAKYACFFSSTQNREANKHRQEDNKKNVSQVIATNLDIKIQVNTVNTQREGRI